MVKGRKKITKKLRQKKDNDIKKKYESLEDSQLFVEDTKRTSVKILESKELTKRKQAILERRKKLEAEALAKKNRNKNVNPIKKDEKLGKLISEKTEKLLKLGKKQQSSEQKKNSKKVEEYDLWDTQDDKVNDDNEYFKEIDERHKTATKTRKVKLPKTAKEVVNIMPAVEVVPSGASYRPDENEHNQYLQKILKEEIKFIKDSEKIKKSLSLKEGETYATQRDRYLEAASGLFDNDTEIKEEILSDDEEGKKNFSRSLPKYKTMKQRKRAAAQKLLELRGAEIKRKRKDENLIDKVPSISKKLSIEEKYLLRTIKLRKRKALLRKCTKTFAREDEKFKPEMDPFLLKDEIPDCMRRLNPQGNVLSSRMKSLEKRNIICGKEAKKKKIPTKLQYKFIEKRDHKRVGIGYKPI
ncbi:Glioma tumor suppressor candidate region gene 2 protein [Strongyloides ratti]|uniref:Ribosome biogenesis protein NOP53 n=1 Tax=Strongyloides ratti TaxID=34506 RepID=A0A090LI88_STRRB|nr:Glioma tumor suppressor candidate region gene 2 protein [Strongyloides ratti]CEF69467.1 Glioma tumor suppressor candidate region gene 2 protein [Strongyloides ratti]